MPVKDRNRALTAVLVEQGMSEEDAQSKIAEVFDMIAPALIAGKPVYLPGVGDLRPKRRWAYVPGSCDRKAREECRVSMRTGTVWKGDPFDCDPPVKPKGFGFRLGGLQ